MEQIALRYKQLPACRLDIMLTTNHYTNTLYKNYCDGIIMLSGNYKQH